MTELTTAPRSTPSPSPRVSVAIDSVDVKYRVYEERYFSARDLIGGGFKRRRSADVHAVQNLTLDIGVGEVVGIVGSNGSGKSSLLRAIAGLQSIQSGSIKVRGEAHLLGVNAALKPLLSGHRNVMLGGLAMGLARSEIMAEMDNIVEFSGLGDAMKRPMGTYSSGMKARLGFSIATIRVPDILLIDEALAVGDKEFREKSLARIRDIRAQAGTVIMVTHSMSEIRRSCSRAIWLEQGELRADGAVDDVLKSYEG